MWFFIGWAKRFHFLRRNGHVKPCWPRRISPVPTQARTCTFLSCPLLSMPSHWNPLLVSWNEISSHSFPLPVPCLTIFSTISRKKSSVLLWQKYVLSFLAWILLPRCRRAFPRRRRRNRGRGRRRGQSGPTRREVLSTLRPPWRILHYNQGIMTVIGQEFCKIKTSSKNVQQANGARADCPENFRIWWGRCHEATGPLNINRNLELGKGQSR